MLAASREISKAAVGKIKHRPLLIRRLTILGCGVKFRLTTVQRPVVSNVPGSRHAEGIERECEYGARRRRGCRQGGKTQPDRRSRRLPHPVEAHPAGYVSGAPG